MHFTPATQASQVLHDLLISYYREGEDADISSRE